MSLTPGDWDLIKNWQAFLTEARSRADVHRARGHDAPDLTPDAKLDATAGWLAVLPRETHRTYHALINHLHPLLGIIRLAGVEGLPSKVATLDTWSASVALLAPRVPSTAGTAAAAGKDTRPEFILAVEDSATWQKILVDRIEVSLPWIARTGLRMVSSRDEAVAQVEGIPRTSDVVVILDLGIPAHAGDDPSRECGLEVLAHLRKRRPHWPVIVWSVPTDSIDDHLMVSALGIVDYLPKSVPTLNEELPVAVRRAVEETPYSIELDARGSSVVLDGIHCALEPRQRDLLWEMQSRSWLTAAAWETATGLGANSFHDLISSIHTRLADSFNACGKYFDMRRLIGRRPVDADDLDDDLPLLEYQLRAEVVDPVPDIDARRSFRALSSPPAAGDRRRRMRVLVIDDEQEWRDRVVDSLRDAEYDVQAGSFDHDPTWAPDVKPDVVCVDLIDIKDPRNALPAGIRWLAAYREPLRSVRVVVLSTVADFDDLRTMLIRDYGIRLWDVISKISKRNSDDWFLRLLRSLHRIERERIVGAGVVLDAQGWPATLIRTLQGQWQLRCGSPSGSSTGTGVVSVRLFNGRNRMKLIERLSSRPFLPVPWPVLYRAVYDDGTPDPRNDRTRLNRLAQLVDDCRLEVDDLVARGKIPALDARRFILFAEGGYTLNARIVQERATT